MGIGELIDKIRELNDDVKALKSAWAEIKAILPALKGLLAEAKKTKDRLDKLEAAMQQKLATHKARKAGNTDPYQGTSEEEDVPTDTKEEGDWESDSEEHDFHDETILT